MSFRGGALSHGRHDFATSRDVIRESVERACDPSLHEPNLSLDLEIADLVNTKKANTPREAAVEVIRLTNHRNTHVSMLALHLLDILVKNCGYAFHLQISTKDFLNELVRRFPERPPVFPPPPMAKVLELIHEWKNTLCLHSKHKEDLVHIRDMHRLLSYKGYRFPDYDKRSISVLNPSDNLQSTDELEEEDRSAQAAKLQELIRRGSPKDLAAAQELMKVMSGAEPEKRPDYEGKVQAELDRIQQRILLLNEMLNNAKPKERFVEGDAFDQIARKCRSVQPKIQKWIEESAETDPGAIDRLLLMNDLINNIVNRYEAFKSGDRTATADIDSTFGVVPGSSKPKEEAISLIDFDFDAVESTLDNSMSLAGLSMGAGSSSAPPANSSLSLFDLDSIDFASTPATVVPSHTPSVSQISGSYFNNALNGNSSSSTGPLTTINWGNAPSNSKIAEGERSSTPGAIQLTRSPNTALSSSPFATTSQASSAKDPFGDLFDLKF